MKLTVEPGALAASVPSLLLQPLVENAVRHGIAPRAKPGRVDIRARRENNRLQLESEDDGCGFRQDWREGLGLKNTRARLEQLYGTEHKLELLPARSYETGALVRLTLPLKGRCSYCHVATDDLSSADFPADESEPKKKARELLRVILKVK